MVLEQICAVHSDDEVSFEIGAIFPIRKDDVYDGYRVAMTVKFEALCVPLSIDVSNGDATTPHAVSYLQMVTFSVESICPPNIKRLPTGATFRWAS